MKKLVSKRRMHHIHKILCQHSSGWYYFSDSDEYIESETVTWVVCRNNSDSTWYDEYIRFGCADGYEVRYNPKVTSQMLDWFNSEEEILEAAVPLGRFRRIDHALNRLDLIRHMILGK